MTPHCGDAVRPEKAGNGELGDTVSYVHLAYILHIPRSSSYLRQALGPARPARRYQESRRAVDSFSAQDRPGLPAARNIFDVPTMKAGRVYSKARNTIHIPIQLNTISGYRRHRTTAAQS